MYSVKRKNKELREGMLTAKDGPLSNIWRTNHENAWFTGERSFSQFFLFSILFIFNFPPHSQIGCLQQTETDILDQFMRDLIRFNFKIIQLHFFIFITSIASLFLFLYREECKESTVKASNITPRNATIQSTGRRQRFRNGLDERPATSDQFCFLRGEMECNIYTFSENFQGPRFCILRIKSLCDFV